MAETKEQQIERAFTYHPPKDDQPERYAAIRDQAKGLAHFLLRVTPASREQSVALTHLEEVVFWANASIAREERPLTPTGEADLEKHRLTGA